MPRPLPPGLGGEGFDRLLAELSAEFERLRRQNAELSRENLQLRACSGGEELEATPLEGEAAAQRALAKEAAEQPSAWRVETGHAAKPEKVLTLAQLRSEVNSQAKWCSEAEPNCGLTALQDQFRRLDASGLGRLQVEDLVRILVKHGEDVEPEALIDTVRVVNNSEPLDLGLDGADPDERAAASVDFPAFKRLLTDRGLVADVERFGGPKVEKCFKSLRQALREEATTPPTKLRLQPSRKDLSNEMHTGTTKWLDTLPVAVILVNALVTGLSTDYQEHEDVWDIFEYFFVSFYFLEFVSKIALFGCSGYFNGPERWWNMFDFVCLIISLGDTAVEVWLAVFVQDGANPDLSALMLIKIFRLARLARLLRTLRFKIFSDLKLMVLGVFSGLRVLTWAIVLLTVLIYLVGVAMASTLSKDEPEFGSVLSAMFTLFRCWTDGCVAYDGTPLAERLRKQYGIAFMMFHILVTMFVTVGVFNLIMAIFIDNVVTSQMMRRQKEMGEKSTVIEMKFKRLFTGFVRHGSNSNLRMSLFERAKKELMNLGGEDRQPKAFGKGWSSVDAEWDHLRDVNVTITQEVFQEWLKDESFQHLLDEAEIETANQTELFDVLDADMGGELSMDELTTGLMKLRGPVTKADIVAVRLKVRHLTRLLEDLPVAAPSPAEPGTEP